MEKRRQAPSWSAPGTDSDSQPVPGSSLLYYVSWEPTPVRLAADVRQRHASRTAEFGEELQQQRVAAPPRPPAPPAPAVPAVQELLHRSACGASSSAYNCTPLGTSNSPVEGHEQARHLDDLQRRNAANRVSSACTALSHRCRTPGTQTMAATEHLDWRKLLKGKCLTEKRIRCEGELPAQGGRVGTSAEASPCLADVAAAAAATHCTRPPAPPLHSLCC